MISAFARLRSIAFFLWIYGTMTVYGICCLPFLLVSERAAMAAIRGWARLVLFGARFIVGIKVEFRGLEYRPKGPALVAGKHMSMLDTIAPFIVLDQPAYVLKHSLMYMPAFGWYAWRTKMVAVRREDAAKALRGMARDCAARIAEGRQIVIFPEGTRSDPGVDPDYKPGVAALYRDLKQPCHLLATNSGQFWPGHGIGWKPGTVVFEFLPPIEAGLPRGEFMRELKSRLETASNTLLAERA